MQRSKYYTVVFLLAVAAGTILESRRYNIGTLGEMGSGFFPLWLGILLLAVTILIALLPESGPTGPESALPEEEVPAVAPGRRLRAWAAIGASALVFIVAAPYLGFVVATFLMIFIAAFGDPANSVRNALWLSALVTLAAVFLFYYVLAIQMPLWPVFVP